MKLKTLFLFFFSALFIRISAVTAQKNNTAKSPNFVILLADDLGYGDLSCFGHPTISTPNLRRMAQEGMRFTQFYVAADVCTPSRAGLLTGRLPIRYGMAGTKSHGVLFPNSAQGLPESEVTIADVLKKKGYRTGIIGKWHLGDLPQYMPNSHGFDYYFGVPYSNDMKPLPLFRNREIIELAPPQNQLTQRYTKEALNFIKRNKNNHFFLYYAFNAPHTPLAASEAFRGKSLRGLFGDVVHELDWSVGQILDLLDELDIAENTLVVFLSDNGPWLIRKQNGGSAGLLYEGKGSTYEGGMHVPAIFWWPGTIKPDQINRSIAKSLDVFPTLINLAKGQAPNDRAYDGNDIMPLLTGEAKQVDSIVYYYNRSTLYAVRVGAWKAHFITKPSYSKQVPTFYKIPLLYNLNHDPSEKYNVNMNHPEIIKRITKIYENFESSIVPVPAIMDAMQKTPYKNKIKKKLEQQKQ